eukprot:gene16769-22948_t
MSDSSVLKGNSNQSTIGSIQDTGSGDIVIISVTPDPPYGVNFVADNDGCAAVIESFDRLPNGKFGPLQKHGGLHYGDVLFEINDTPLENTLFNDVLKIINDRNLLKKTFKFINQREYYRKKRGLSLRAQPQDGKNSFLSVIKSSRINETEPRKFVEFEIACQLRVVSMKVQKDTVYQWSVWKRYSYFENLHVLLKESLGWQMDGIEFPSSHTFVINKLSPTFIDQRRSELKEYWQRVISIELVTDFAKHHCSMELKAFLDVDENMQKNNTLESSDMLDSNSGGNKQVLVTAANQGAGRPKSTRINSRRISTTASKTISQSNGFNYDEAVLNASTVVQTTIAPSNNKVDTQVSANPPSVKYVPPPPSQTNVNLNNALELNNNESNKKSASQLSNSDTNSNIPPPVTGARANLLSSISALRKD